MDFRWKITSRTGDICEGEDDFPKPEVKDSANTFELFLSDNHPIQAPYGQNIFGKQISLSVPDGHRLIFKRRVRMTVGTDMQECDNRSYTYIIAFEKMEG